jgi:hypothetical protein
MAVYCLDDLNPTMEFENRYDLVRYISANVDVGNHVVVKCIPTFENIIVANSLTGWIVTSESNSQIIVELLDDALNKLTI